MTNNAEISEQIQSALALDLPLVAVSFSNVEPAKTERYDGAQVAAGCKFWETALESTFTTSAEDHKLCSIGIYTHNLADAPSSQQQELQSTLSAMTGLDYIREQEVGALPVVKESHRYVTYGRLREIQTAPDVVLLFAHSQQGLIITEAAARIDANIPLAMGRPACAVIANTLNQQRATMSLGCCGARAYLGVLGDHVALWALPGSKIAAYAEQIEKLAKGNSVLTQFHKVREVDVLAGQQPSVDDSLQKLG